MSAILLAALTFSFGFRNFLSLHSHCLSVSVALLLPPLRFMYKRIFDFVLKFLAYLLYECSHRNKADPGGNTEHSFTCL